MGLTEGLLEVIAALLESMQLVVLQASSLLEIALAFRLGDGVAQILILLQQLA